jgi:hypothetical protein
MYVSTWSKTLSIRVRRVPSKRDAADSRSAVEVDGKADEDADEPWVVGEQMGLRKCGKLR